MTPAATEARVTYDAATLYIAVRCTEPKPKDMHVTGVQRDDSVWEGDSLDVFIAAGEAPVPYVHLILNPANVQWDALFTEQNALDFNPAWKSATRVGADEWTAELAIPWAELKMKPPAQGEKHRANLCRQRRTDSEQTSWSQMMGGFLEHDNFGTWTFR